MRSDAAALGIPLTAPAAGRLLALARLVREAPLNVTAIRAPDDVRRKHLADSLSCLRVLQTPGFGQTLLDLGSGGGFPGLPLAIVCPELQVCLLEANARKGAFLEATARELGLANVSVLVDRAEHAGQQPEWRERFDWVVARAVAPLPVLLEYGLPLCRVGGLLIAMKGPRAQQEVVGAQTALACLGGRLASEDAFELPAGAERRVLVCVRKTKATPRRFPRRPGVPARQPL